MGFLSPGCALQHVKSWFPNQGSNLCPLQWKPGVLNTGMLWNSPSFFKIMCLLENVKLHMWPAFCFYRMALF